MRNEMMRWVLYSGRGNRKGISFSSPNNIPPKGKKSKSILLLHSPYFSAIAFGKPQLVSFGIPVLVQCSLTTSDRASASLVPLESYQYGSTTAPHCRRFSLSALSPRIQISDAFVSSRLSRLHSQFGLVLDASPSIKTFKTSRLESREFKPTPDTDSREPTPSSPESE